TSTTDGQGLARIGYTLGTGIGNNRILATAATSGGTATIGFNVTGIAAAPSRLVPASGFGQVVAALQTTAQPIGLLVQDGFGNPVSGVSVGWQVVAGGGSVTSNSTV